MESFLQKTIEQINMSDWCGDIILNTSIRDNNNYWQIWWCIEYNIIKKITMMSFALVKALIGLVKEEMVGKSIN